MCDLNPIYNMIGGVRYNRKKGGIMMAMAVKQDAAIQVVDDVQPGDRVEIEHTAMIGGILLRKIKSQGTVVRIERRRRERHFCGNLATKVYRTVILLRRSAGELKNIVINKFTIIRPRR